MKKLICRTGIRTPIDGTKNRSPTWPNEKMYESLLAYILRMQVKEIYLQLNE